eukprot:TRINITY_DN1300_c0_g1_i3.p1 TRINITY_DN1300_c0_g1~~TRINITY_DN1300_c0_g1_i3.p1  ORF type:complete len:367 (+),score=67.71 TRINITY_DN1300_c0_g1_i3:495-1595(+)
MGSDRLSLKTKKSRCFCLFQLSGVMFVLLLVICFSVAYAGLPAPSVIPHINNQFYGHGAFFGASGQLMSDPQWNKILQSLMPDVHTTITTILSKKGNGNADIILKFENNPVVSAYGMVKTQQLDAANYGGHNDRLDKLQAFEWDCWLPTQDVKKFVSGGSVYNSAAASDLMETILIAHGNLVQTVGENKLNVRQYDSVLKTDKTDQGGLMPNSWIDLFYRAVELSSANATRLDYLQKGYQTGTGAYFVRSNSTLGSQLNTFVNKISYNDFFTFFKAKFGKQFQVLFDIKSRDATPSILGALVYQMNQRNMVVYGIGSFVFTENAGISNVSQTIPKTGHVYPGMNSRFLFFFCFWFSVISFLFFSSP